MTGRRRTSVAIAGILGAAVLGSGAYLLMKQGRRNDQASSAKSVMAKSPMALLAEGVRRSDPQALMTLCQRILVKTDQPLPAIGDEEASDLVEVLDGLRAGFLKYNSAGRASAIAAATHILDRFSVDPAPASWLQARQPIHDLLLAALADNHPDVRSTALTEIGRNWDWLPGRSMTRLEETTLSDWKMSLYAPAVKCLSDLEPKSRAAAVACIGALPFDDMARPAVANIDYPDNGGVRYKTLMTFANRPNLLSVDMVLKRLHDTETGIPELAEIVLKGRGLNKEQIFLGKQMVNPHPEVRASVIPLIRDRTDIDPEVWLIQLSHDPDDSVRAKAVESLISRESPEVDRRLREITSTDSSPAVRAIASKHVVKTTAALPPLPGGTGLNLRAN